MAEKHASGGPSGGPLRGERQGAAPPGPPTGAGFGRRGLWVRWFLFFGVWGLLFLNPFLLTPGELQPEPLVDEFGKHRGTIHTGNYFKAHVPEYNRLLINPGALASQSKALTGYFDRYGRRDSRTVRAGILSTLGITLQDVKDTLRFVENTAAKDLENKRPSRLSNPDFLREHFDAYRWYPFMGSGKQQRNRLIRITKYAVFTIEGRPEKSAPYNCALYGLPGDETGMPLEEAEKHKRRLNRFRYTRSQVLAGAYDGGGAPALVWVTRGGLEEALMEGSICVELPGGIRKYFNVDRNNGIPYDPSVKNPRLQERYWYFGEVSRPRGYGMDIGSQVPLYPGAAFAGDIFNLGLGKLVGMVYAKPGTGKRVMRMGLLADTGGAFTPNLRQLDYYAGVFPTREAFRKKNKTLPTYAEVYIFIKKRTKK